VNLGQFPALVTMETNLQVEGDVVEVSDAILDQLDRYEGVDQGMYRRVTTTTKAGHDVMVYMFNHIVKSWRPDGGYYDISYHDTTDLGNRFA